MSRKIRLSFGRSGMAFFLAAVLLVVFVSPLAMPEKAFAETAEAYAIKFSSQTGSGFQVTNSSGRSIPVRSDMRLYSGYVLQTAAGNYVYLSLDSKKAVKLDQNTKVEIQKEGTKNVIKVLAGKLFFNVSEKLKSTESFDVSTSTMSMGIRGTSGCAFAEMVLEGNGAKKITEGVHIYNGLGEVGRNTEDESGKKNGILVEPGYKVEAAIGLGSGGKISFSDSSRQMELDEIPPMVLEEIQKEPELYQKITEQMPQMKDISMEELGQLEEEGRAKEEAAQAARDTYVKQGQEEVKSQHILAEKPEQISQQKPDEEKPSATDKIPGADTENNAGNGFSDNSGNDTGSDSGSGSGSGTGDGSESGSGSGTGGGSGSGTGGGTQTTVLQVKQTSGKLSKNQHSTTEDSWLEMELGLASTEIEPVLVWCDADGNSSSAPEEIIVDGNGSISSDKVTFRITPYCSGTFYYKIKAGEAYSELCTIEVESGFDNVNLTSDRMQGTLYLFGIQKDNWVSFPEKGGFTTQNIVWLSGSSGWKTSGKPGGFTIEQQTVTDGAIVQFNLNTDENIEEGTYYFRFLNGTSYSEVYTLTIALTRDKPGRYVDHTRESEINVQVVKNADGTISPAIIPITGDAINVGYLTLEKGEKGHVLDSALTWVEDNQNHTVKVTPRTDKNPTPGEHTIYIVAYTKATGETEERLALLVEPITINYVVNNQTT